MKTLFNYSGRRMVVTVLMLSMPFFMYSQGNSEKQFLKKITKQEAALNQGQLQKLERFEQNALNKNVQLVKVGNLKALQNRGALPIKIPGRNGALVAHATSVEPVSENEFIWNGEFRRKEHGYVTIIAKDGAIYGQINIEDEIYNLQDLGNGKNALIQIDEGKYGPSECATPHGQSQGSFSAKAQSRNHCNTNVRVLVLFTNAANQVGNPQNDANLFVNQTNQACRNSAVTQHDLNFELVGVQQLAGFVENAGDILDDRRRLRLNNNARNLREQFDADLVVLLTNGNYGNNTIFGVAYLDESGDDEFGFAISEIDAAGGRFTFTHEVAHLFGARHDNDLRVGNNLSPFAHAHNFTRGWLWWRRTRRTILNGLSAGEARIQHFSNPDVQFDGRATGIANDRDNARQLEARACDIADYREFQEPMSVFISGPSTMTAGFNHTWCANVNECENVTSYTWAWSENGFTYFNFGSNRCVSRLSFPTNADRIFLRVISRCADGQTATDFHTVNISSDIFRIASTEENHTDKILQISDKLAVNVFPNPTSEVAHIKVTALEEENVEIYVVDLMGRTQKVIYKGMLDTGTHFFNEPVTDLNSGLVSIVVKTKKGVESLRLLIQR